MCRRPGQLQQQHARVAGSSARTVPAPHRTVAFSLRSTHAPWLPSTRRCAHSWSDSSAATDPQSREPRTFHVKHSLGQPQRLRRAHAVRTLSVTRTPWSVVRFTWNIAVGWPRRAVFGQRTLAASLRIDTVMTPGAISLGGALSRNSGACLCRGRRTPLSSDDHRGVHG